MLSIPISFTHNPERKPERWPVSRGVPLPAGHLHEVDELGVVNPFGVRIPAQFRVLGRWSDGSLKWVLVDFQADADPSGKAVYTVTDRAIDGTRTPQIPSSAVRVEETDHDLFVDTGAIRFRIDRRQYGLFHSVSRSEVQTLDDEDGGNAPPNGPGGDTWARISESSSDGGLVRRLYGPGGLCRASLARDSYTSSIEEQGPLRTVIRLESALEADVPMHHYSGYRPLRCITRIHVYAGHAFVRVLQTHLFTCNPREVEIEDLAVDVPIELSGSKTAYAFGLDGVHTGFLNEDESLMIAQKSDQHVRVSHGSSGNERVLEEGEACEGWAILGDEARGVGVACRHMAEEYPAAFELSGDGRLTLFVRHDPNGSRLSLSRYAEEVAWHEGEGVYADGTGIAKTTEFYLCYYDETRQSETIEMLRCALSRPHAAVYPEWMARCEVAGGFLVRRVGDAIESNANPAQRGEPDAGLQPDQPSSEHQELISAADLMLTGFADWLVRNIHLGRWYGFVNHGDVLVDWDEEADDWKFHGRWGWCNSEWDPRHAIWVQYLRTGDPNYFHLGEAMTRHSMDVDTCHWHPFRPYMVGGCYRHGVDHFSDEPCASHTFIDNWVDFYYLTGDGRALEVIREAGAFFLRYRWTEDPSYSFSLRSIANTLRGLLYVYEATGEERFMKRAEEVYGIIARGQNEDGSWHKRFQVSTRDRLPNQLPYGMATEGTTLAVEMGTAESFSDDEFKTLGGPFTRLTRDLPYEEQKGYQTHYLLIGLELMHRITGRKDVVGTYLSGVDWFCGFPDTFASDRPLQEHYSGILCRHLGYAHRLTGDKRYLETGIEILKQLIESQDWSDDSRKRGSINMSPTYLSLLFFGVPGFLAEL